MSAPKTEFGAWYASQQAGGGSTGGSSSSSAPGAPGGSLLSSVSAALTGAAAAALGGAAAPSPAGGGADVEAAAGAGDGTGGAPGAGGGMLSGFVAAVGGYLPAGAAAAVGAAPPPPPAPADWTCGLSYGQRVQAFAVLACGSVSLYAASFFVFLPLLLITPSKFATAFTFASLLWLAAFAVLRGPRATLAPLAARDNAPFTAAYVGSLALSLYATLVVQSYFLALAAVVVQVSAGVWYSSSYVPGGPAAAAALGRVCLGTVRGVATSVCRVR
jgi:hypothetical protein